MVNFGNAPNNSDNIQDLWYALREVGYFDSDGNASFVQGLDGPTPHLEVHNTGRQPDGDLVSDRADGEAFVLTGPLNAGETITSDWIDTDGWRTIEVAVISDVQSAPNGVEVQFTQDVQATNPQVESTISRTFANEDVDRGFGSFDFGAKLDGFRLKYTNNSDVAPTEFNLVVTLRVDAVPDSADYVNTDPLGQNFVTVGTDPSLNGVGIAEPASLFGDLQTIERTTVIDRTSSFGTSVIRDETDATGSAIVEEDPAPSGEIHLSTGTTADSSIRLRTAEYGRYTPGFSAQQGCGIRIPTLPTEGEVRWGYFDDSDGFYWGYDGTQQEAFVARKKSGVETERIYRSNWNRQDVDNELNRAWNAGEGDIFQIDFSWYGYGIILFSVVTQTSDDNLTGTPNQKTVPVHAISVSDESSIADPNQPITVEVENSANGEDIDVYVGGRQFSVFGQPPAEQRITSSNVEDVSVSSNGWTHIMSWRRDPNESSNSKLNINSFDTIQNADTRFALVVDANISGTNYGLPDLVSDDETLLQVSSAGTFDGIGSGTKVFETLAVGGGGKKSAGASSEVNVRLGQQNVLSIVAQSLGVTSDVSVTFRMEEDW